MQTTHIISSKLFCVIFLVPNFISEYKMLSVVFPFSWFHCCYLYVKNMNIMKNSSHKLP